MERNTQSVRLRRHQLCKILSDGQFHSGQKLAIETKMSRTAIWKHIQVLKNYGVTINSVPGKGHQMAYPIEMLDKSKIENALTVAGNPFVKQLSVFFEIDSTNNFLMSASSLRPIHGHVVLAEFQSKGRGRRGNEWYSPLAAGINLSIGWHYHEPPEAISVLSLAVGAVCCKVLQQYQIEDIGLKWPNDILYHGKKLAGILVEMRSETAGFTDVVLGIGMNVQFPSGIDFEQKGWIDLASIPHFSASRNQLVADLISSIMDLLNDFAQMSSREVVTHWRQYECVSGKRAELQTAQVSIEGNVLDVDDSGALLFATEEGTYRFTSGEIRLKLRV